MYIKYISETAFPQSNDVRITDAIGIVTPPSVLAVPARPVSLVPRCLPVSHQKNNIPSVTAQD